MLELIFRGFLEWGYGMALECWDYFSSALLDIMSLDFAYLRSHVPVIPDIMQVLLAVGWALLLGNLVFQAARSMLSGLGFEGEDPKLLFARTFVFAFLLMASPQICEIGLNLTTNIMMLLEIPNAVNVQLVDESIFGSLGAAWLLVIIFSLIIMFKTLKLILEIAERYVILAMLTITAPLAFAAGGSRSTSDIFSGWCRMYGSMCLLMVTNVIFFKMLLSVLSTVPSGLDVFPWMVLILAIVKVAKKADAIITRIGLNPAITGDRLGRSLPGMLTYAVVRGAASGVSKAIGKSMGGKGGGRAPGSTPPGGGPRMGGPSAGGRASTVGTAGAQAARGEASSTPTGGGPAGSQQTATQQSAAQPSGGPQVHTQQSGVYHSAAQQAAAQQTGQDGAVQSGGQQQAAAWERSAGSSHTVMGQAPPGEAGRSQQTRKTAVPPGARRAPSHVRTAAAGSVKPGGAIPEKTAPTAGTQAPGGTAGQRGAPVSSVTAQKISQATDTRFTQVTAQQGSRGAAASAAPTAERGTGQVLKTPGQPGGGRTIPPGTAAGASIQSEARFTHRTGLEDSGIGPVPASSPMPQPGTAGTATSSPGQASVQEPRHGRNVPPPATGPSSPGRQPSPARQEGRTASRTATPPVTGTAPGLHPGPAGTASGGRQARQTPPVQGKTAAPMTDGGVSKRPSPPSPAAGKPRSTRKPAPKPPRHNGGPDHGR